MPLYDYECASCGHVFELRQSFDAAAEGVCPQCEGVTRRKFHPVPIIYKGSGFYTTDYKGSGYSDTAAKEKEEDGSKEKKETAKASTGGSKNDNGTKSSAKAATGSSQGKKEEAAKGG